jgi:hypothetical protein
VACCPAVMGMVQEKHNKVVRCITKAIAQGTKEPTKLPTQMGAASKVGSRQCRELHKTMKHLPPTSSPDRNSDSATPNQTYSCTENKAGPGHTPQGRPTHAPQKST